MISRVVKSHTSKYSFGGRSAVRDFNCFQYGSACKAYERAILRENILSEFIENYVIPKELSTSPQLLNLIKSIFRSIIISLDVIVNQVGSLQEVRTSEQQEQKG